MLFMANSEYDEAVQERFESVEQYVENSGGTIIYITPENITDPDSNIYNMDSKTMKTILRADYGLVVLDNGVIAGKYNYRDIPY